MRIQWQDGEPQAQVLFQTNSRNPAYLVRQNEMRLKLFFTQTEHKDQVWGSDGCDWAMRMRNQLRQSGKTPYEMSDSLDEAGIIVFWEPHQDTQVTWAPRLRAHPLIHEFPNKVFVVSVEDIPLGFLPGLYTSLPAHLHHPQRHRTWIFCRTQNLYIGSQRRNRRVASPPDLASFTGAN